MREDLRFVLQHLVDVKEVVESEFCENAGNLDGSEADTVTCLEACPGLLFDKTSIPPPLIREIFAATFRCDGSRKSP
jgi:hypothetical protein